MTVSLSMLAGAGAQFFDDNGDPLSGGLLYTYLAGTTSDATTFMTSTGHAGGDNANPIVLDAAGRVPYQIWLTDGVSYKFVVKTSGGVTVRTYDNMYGAQNGDLTGLLAASSGSSLVGFLQSGTGAVVRTVQSKLRDFVNIMDFGASPGASTAVNAAAIQAAFSTAKCVIIPSATFDCGNTVLYIDHDNQLIIGDGTPSVDYSNNTFTGGPVIKATIASSTYDGIGIKSLGIDASLSSLTEGVAVSNCKNVYIDGLTVIGSATKNHCCLVENVESATLNGITTFSGIQGVAVKAIDFTVSNITSYDTTGYGFTLRYSPSAPCYSGIVSNINCQTNLLAKSGGFIVMNDQSGAAVRDLIINNVLVDNCNNGIYITNSGNATKATNIKFSNVKIKNIAAYAFQTFGDVENIQVDGIEFTDCSGTFFTNLATGTTGLHISNLTQKNAGIALFSGSGHTLCGWKKIGGGGFFAQNTSTLIQYYDMDTTVTAVSNITDASGTGTIARECEFPNDVTITTNGTLYGMRYKSNYQKKIANTMATNAVTTIFTLSGVYDNIADINVSFLSTTGRFSSRFTIAGTTIVRLASSSLATTIFDIVISGNDVQFKYLDTPTTDVYVDIIYSVLTQDV